MPGKMMRDYGGPNKKAKKKAKKKKKDAAHGEL